ncbi:MAG: MFS transporter [Candidatus Peribacteraceae bacterium]|nr:MFS transporter [Candidatus Peribacteraceae bacterium]
MDEVKSRVLSGAGFGFFQTMFMAFALLVPTMYFSSLDISIVVYAFLLSIGDVFSFIMKPILGALTDRHGERRFLLFGGLAFIFCLFLVGQTTDIFLITIFKIISGVASALVFVTIIIYSLRYVKDEPENKIGIFNGLSNLGWIVGLLIPGMFVDSFGISPAFYLILVVGIIWVVFMFKFARKYESGESAKPSFAFVKRIWKFILLKTMDLAMFSAFIFFFTRYALKDLGLPGSTVSFIVIAEVLLFSGTNFLIGRVSNRRIRKYWLPLAIILHLGAATAMVFGTEISHYYIVGMLIGAAGGFVDIWMYSHISENFGYLEKGKVLGTLGWSHDLSTIIGAQVPILFIAFGFGTFTALYVFPVIMAITYIFMKLFKRRGYSGYYSYL